MAKLINGTRVVTNEVRASYAHVAEAVSVNGGDAKYSMSVIIPKTDKETLSLINKAIDQAINDGLSKFGNKKPNKAALKLPLRDGDVEKEDEAYQDAYFIRKAFVIAWNSVVKDRDKLMPTWEAMKVSGNPLQRLRARQMIELTVQGPLVNEVHEHTRMVLERIVIHSKTHFTVRFLDGTAKEVCLPE